MAREPAGTPGLLRHRQRRIDLRGGAVSRLVWRVVSITLGSAALALVLFHVWLFWDQWQIGRLSDPLLAAKWAGSALLVVAFAICRRQRVALLRGRRGVVIWTLAAVLHVGADHPGLAVTPETASAVLSVLPGVAGAALLAASLLLLFGARRTRTDVRARAPRRRVTTTHPFRRSPLLVSPRGLRAPPLRFA
jgi:hypothetical protein